MKAERLNLLYNMCDVGLTTAMGEGWGLTSFEHVVTGAPQIVPDHTSFKENWTEGAILLNPVKQEYIFYELANMFVVCADDVALGLTELYEDSNYYKKMAMAAYNKTQCAMLRWTNVKQRFFKVLEASLDVRQS